MTDEPSHTEAELRTDFGQAPPKQCGQCSTKFYRPLDTCPECGVGGTYSFKKHPFDDWTPQLVKQIVKATAGYAVLKIDLPADHKQWMWWDEGFQGRSRHPGGALESFSLGIDEGLCNARSIELVHWRDTHPQMRRQLRKSMPDPEEAREV